MIGFLKSKPFRNLLLEGTGIVLGLAAASFSVFASEAFAFRFCEWLSLILIVVVFLWLPVRAVIALIRREWLGAVIRIVLLPFVLVAGLLSMVAGSMAGGEATEWDWKKSTLPVEKSEEQKLVARGEKIAEVLSSKTPDGRPMKLRSVDFVIEQREHDALRKIGYEFDKMTPGFFSIGADYRVGRDAWKLNGHSASGDPATFQRNKEALVPLLPQQLKASFVWPLKETIVNQLTDLARAMCAVLEKEQLLPVEGASWRLERTEFRHGLGKGDADSIQLTFGVWRGKERFAWASAELFYDGKKARLGRCGGGVQGGYTANSTMDHEAAVTTVLREWLSQDRGILEKVRERGLPWRSCEAMQPDGIRMIYYEQPAHLFLAEYNMRIEFILPDGRKRRFDLPMNTGGRTSVLVYTGATPDGSAAVRLVSGRHFDVAFDLKALRWVDPAKIMGAVYAGAFLEEKTLLQWFPAVPQGQEQLTNEKAPGQ